jgi:Zn-dependent peptidase ImmA (M78 family)/transcriptional regulator with XRE-family HTH domain
MAAVPVTPKVVRWAVERSGFSVDEIADAIDVDASTVRAWFTGEKQPSLGEARKLAKTLRRPLAFLLWPEPPADEPPHVAFRAPVASEMRDLNANEQRYIRQAVRLQEIVDHLRVESGKRPPAIPHASIREAPASAAASAREWLGISVDTQVAWGSEYEALRQWRTRFERCGIHVFFFALGGDACRGITLSHEGVPVIVINTAFNPYARIFTIFHELGHTLTRTTSACAASLAVIDDAAERVERWCDQFAAAVLMPWSDVEKFLHERKLVGIVDDLGVAKAVSRRFKVSVPAAALRLINGGRATWRLWHAIPRDVNNKTSGGAPPDEPRTTPVIRLHELGERLARELLDGIRSDLIERSQVASYLRVDDNSLTEIEARVLRAAAG